MVAAGSVFCICRGAAGAAVLGGMTEWALAAVDGASCRVLHPIATSTAAIPTNHILESAPTIASFSHADARHAHIPRQT